MPEISPKDAETIIDESIRLPMFRSQKEILREVLASYAAHLLKMMPEHYIGHTGGSDALKKYGFNRAVDEMRAVFAGEIGKLTNE